MRIPTWLAAALTFGFGSAGCADTSTLPTTIVHPTLVEVHPTEFLANVPCLDATGAMQSYVATVYDLGPVPLLSANERGELFDENGVQVDEYGMPLDPALRPVGFPLPSSGPVDCTQPVGFGQVVPGNRYRAEIFGYDNPNLTRLAPGVPIMVDAETGERVEPRWSARCGDEVPTICHAQLVRTLRCTTLVDARPSDLTSVEVRIDSLLGSLACGEDPGQISRFEVEIAPGERVSAACGDAVVLDSVTAGLALLLPVFAYEAGADEASWGTTCTATPVAGTAVRASCTTLTDRGGVDISPLAVLEAIGLDCSALGELTLDNPANENDTRTVTAGSCERSVRFSGIPRGPVEVNAKFFDGSTEHLATCEADVIPNQAVPSTCSPLEP